MNHVHYLYYTCQVWLPFKISFEMFHYISALKHKMLLCVLRNKIRTLGCKYDITEANIYHWIAAISNFLEDNRQELYETLFDILHIKFSKNLIGHDCKQLTSLSILLLFLFLSPPFPYYFISCILKCFSSLTLYYCMYNLTDK